MGRRGHGWKQKEGGEVDARLSCLYSEVKNPRQLSSRPAALAVEGGTLGLRILCD